jgi:hypothetical protein
MRSDGFLRWISFGLLAGIGLVGCAGEDELAPPFPSQSGQPSPDAAEYAPGPYGIGVGSTIENYKFVGFANAMAVNNAMQEIHLSDFYNPTGAGVFGPESPYGAGEPMPKALLIDVSSVWCGPCNYEAANVLPGLYDLYQPQGGEFLLQLADGPTVGDPAEPIHLSNWTAKYHVDYPAAIDPSYKLGALFEADAYPANMIIRTKDMKIVEVIAGAPEATSPFWNIFEDVLADQPVLPGD